MYCTAHLQVAIIVTTTTIVTLVLSTTVILGLLWWQSDTKNSKDLQDQAGLLFFIAVFWGFFPVFTAIFTFPQERAMLSKERAADMYRLSAYFLARTTSDLPLDLILPVLFLLVVYFMAALRLSVGPFFLTILPFSSALWQLSCHYSFLYPPEDDVEFSATKNDLLFSSFISSNELLKHGVGNGECGYGDGGFCWSRIVLIGDVGDEKEGDGGFDDGG
ncbi:hypothetical protein RJT34_23811 [Clitoria ternatea]|uniref:ABC-2 type transporter transmembrane domain-containing protein n=1 Tax=Clitoria ternatea TaxID=43366 RepID=A0AAN9FSZ5_CLITE